MGSWIKKLMKAVNNKGGFFTFIRAQFSSQIASVLDFIVTIFLVHTMSMYYVYSSFIGSVSGGIFNCLLNYRWTFRENNCKIKYVIIKYTSVWIGSIFLNTYGTYFFTETLIKNHWTRLVLEKYSIDFFLFPKIIVSILVGFLWNYSLQRMFVYRDINFKKVVNKINNNK